MFTADEARELVYQSSETGRFVKNILETVRARATEGVQSHECYISKYTNEEDEERYTSVVDKLRSLGYQAETQQMGRSMRGIKISW